MSAIRISTPKDLRLIDLGPAAATTNNGHPTGGRIVTAQGTEPEAKHDWTRHATPDEDRERERVRQKSRAYRARHREAYNAYMRERRRRMAA